MNPSSAGIWCNPPPPGTEFSTEELTSVSSVVKEEAPSPPRIIDRIDPYLKSPEYIKYERKIKSEHSRRRSRSGSRRRSRSGSKHRRRRRSRSRSKGHRRHKRGRRSSSRSRSRSRKRGSRDRKRRGRRSRSASPSRSRKSRPKKSRSRHRSRSRTKYPEPPSLDPNVKAEEEDVEEEEEEEDAANENAFKNDGSFMEMFKKMQEEMKQKEADKANQPPESRTPLPAFGKRRGGKVLKTGMVQKTKVMGQEEASDAQDAWTLYMKEVKRYKEACCDDDSKTRLLVK